MKRIIEIEDDLDDTIKSCKEDILYDFKDWLRDNFDADSFDEYTQDRSDTVAEIADSNTPIYFSHIDDLDDLYGNEFEKAYNLSGMSDYPDSNHKQVAIYCYLQQQISEYIRFTLQEYFDEFTKLRDNLKNDGKDDNTVNKRLEQFIDEWNI